MKKFMSKIAFSTCKYGAVITFSNGVFATNQQIFVEDFVEMRDKLCVFDQKRVRSAQFMKGQLFHVVQRIDYAPHAVIDTGCQPFFRFCTEQWASLTGKNF